ncbi:MAG TPA: PilZ domain-containing protein [Planctomycetia bacterium]|nr:PilZ domain-containing protein [Planctomycetia bacterium]
MSMPARADLYWEVVRPGAIVRFLRSAAVPEGCRLGIVARLVSDGRAAEVYPYQIPGGQLQLLPEGVPAAFTVNTADLETYNHEKRAFPRHRGDCTLFLDREDGIPVAARIQDVSLEGVGFTISRRLRIGQPIQLGFVLGSTRQGLIIGASVRSSEPVGPGGRGRHRVGAQFDRRLRTEELAALVP